MNGPIHPAPLDQPAAENRARQIAVLAEPVRLRVLSIMATQPDRRHSVVSLAGALELSATEIAGHIERLRDVGLVVTQPGIGEPRFAPSPEAWVRFGRLLTGKSTYSEPEVEHDGLSIADLPSPVQRVAERLAYRYSSHFSKETVERYVAESYQMLAHHAKTTKHLPSLTSRFASDRLGALAAAQGFDLTGTPEVLFVCVQNSGRSQIAAGLMRAAAGEHVHVRTAGSRPAAGIDPLVATVLEEVGVGLTTEFPKPLTDEVVQAADVVVTMGCGDACPIYPGRRYMDWKIEDPVGRSLEEVRRIRDQIRTHVDELLNGMGITART